MRCGNTCTLHSSFHIVQGIFYGLYVHCTMYMDMLSVARTESVIGGHIRGHFHNHLRYADDVRYILCSRGFYYDLFSINSRYFYIL